MSEDDKLLDGVKGIAEAFGLPPRTVQHLIDSHGLPVIKLGRRTYGKKLAISQWLDARAKEGEADEPGR